MNIETLRSLQQRLREATGPDRELDLAVGVLWGNPPFSISIAQQRGGKPPVFKFTYSLDAVLALMRTTLPGWTRLVDASAPELGIAVELLPPDQTERDGTDSVKGDHDLETHATLLAILSALIAEEEAKEKADATQSL